jgi:hypothetical protein
MERRKKTNGASGKIQIVGGKEEKIKKAKEGEKNNKKEGKKKSYKGKRKGAGK